MGGVLAHNAEAKDKNTRRYPENRRDQDQIRPKSLQIECFPFMRRPSLFSG
jgi:hypothetical protein